MTRTDLTRLFENLEESCGYGFIQPRGGAYRAIDEICATDKDHKFTMDEVGELLADYPLLTWGLKQIISNNY